MMMMMVLAVPDGACNGGSVAQQLDGGDCCWLWLLIVVVTAAAIDGKACVLALAPEAASCLRQAFDNGIADSPCQAFSVQLWRRGQVGCAHVDNKMFFYFKKKTKEVVVAGSIWLSQCGVGQGTPRLSRRARTWPTMTDALGRRGLAMDASWLRRRVWKMTSASSWRTTTSRTS